MPAPNHNTDLTISEMVFNRLTFIDKTDPDVILLVSNYILEIMWQLEVCFQITNATDPINTANVGDEQYYSMLQKMIIADLVAVYILLQIGGSISGGTSTITPGSVFMKKVKAGSVEVEWDQNSASVSSTGLETNSATLREAYKNSAITKAMQLGCIISICDDCSIMASLAQASYAKPFITFKSSSDCGCGG